jgi:hypothetical protein
VNDVRQELGLKTEFALRAQLLEDVELGTAHVAVGDEHQRDDARGGFWAVVGVAAHGGSPLKNVSLR